MKIKKKICLLLFGVVLVATILDYVGNYKVAGKVIELDLTTGALRKTQYLFYIPLTVKEEQNAFSMEVRRFFPPSHNQWEPANRQPMLRKRHEHLRAARSSMAIQELSIFLEVNTTTDKEKKEMLSQTLPVLRNNDPDRLQEIVGMYYHKTEQK